jgi:hypothetical protein
MNSFRNEGRRQMIICLPFFCILRGLKLEKRAYQCYNIICMFKIRRRLPTQEV